MKKLFLQKHNFFDLLKFKIKKELKCATLRTTKNTITVLVLTQVAILEKLKMHKY
jgi:hypothetical protein